MHQHCLSQIYIKPLQEFSWNALLSRGFFCLFPSVFGVELLGLRCAQWVCSGGNLCLKRMLWGPIAPLQSLKIPPKSFFLVHISTLTSQACFSHLRQVVPVSLRPTPSLPLCLITLFPPNAPHFHLFSPWLLSAESDRSRWRKPGSSAAQDSPLAFHSLDTLCLRCSIKMLMALATRERYYCSTN